MKPRYIILVLFVLIVISGCTTKTVVTQNDSQSTSSTEVTGNSFKINLKLADETAPGGRTRLWDVIAEYKNNVLYYANESLYVDFSDSSQNIIIGHTCEYKLSEWSCKITKCCTKEGGRYSENPLVCFDQDKCPLEVEHPIEKLTMEDINEKIEQGEFVPLEKDNGCYFRTCYVIIN